MNTDVYKIEFTADVLEDLINILNNQGEEQPLWGVLGISQKTCIRKFSKIKLEKDDNGEYSKILVSSVTVTSDAEIFENDRAIIIELKKI